jgi:hypothetical protein
MEGFNFMLSPKITLKVLLGQSEFSAEGFLGTDTRTPEEIMAEDLNTIQTLGTTKEKTAGILREIYVKAERAMGNAVKLSEKISATHQEACGRIPSPFPNDGTFQKGQASISGFADGQTIFITPLSIHLIEKYGFFQGKGSLYRIDPQTVVALGELKL